MTVLRICLYVYAGWFAAGVITALITGAFIRAGRGPDDRGDRDA